MLKQHKAHSEMKKQMDKASQEKNKRFKLNKIIAIPIAEQA